jgi:predicted nucleic acid-binding protein
MADDIRPDCFVDTNIWLYAFIESDDKEKSVMARDLIRLSQPAISVQVVNEVCVNMIRKAGFAEEQIRELVASFYAKYRVLDLGHSIMISASELRESYSLSFWDSMIVASALDANVPTPYSEDMQDGLLIDTSLRISNPFRERSEQRSQQG